MPVHSSAMSTPSAFQGSFAGSRSAETLILPLPRLIESPSTVTVPGKRPCTLSKRNRCALVSTGLGDGAQHIAADAAKPVDSDPDCHACFSSKAGAIPKRTRITHPFRRFGRRLTRFCQIGRAHV